MDELRPEFDRKCDACLRRSLRRVDSSTDPMAGLEYGDRQSVAGENSCSRQACNAGADDDGVVAGCQGVDFSAVAVATTPGRAADAW